MTLRGGVKKMDMKKFFKDWIIPIATAIVLALLINRFVFFQVTVPTESMYPTIKVDNRIFVTRVYNRDKLERGDIIVFYSKELDKRLIKRLIGLPGDEIVITKDRQLYVNEKKVDESYVVFNGGKTGTYKVPEGKFFFLGDNRANSWDARSWKEKYIDAKDIQGKARVIVYPFNRFGKFKVGAEALNN